MMVAEDPSRDNPRIVSDIGKIKNFHCNRRIQLNTLSQGSLLKLKHNEVNRGEMKEKIFGAITGLLIGVGLLVAAPTVANAAVWSTYANGNYSVNALLVSSPGVVYNDKGRIFPPASGVGYQQKFNVVVNVVKGKILATHTGDTGVWVDLGVPSPAANSVARCQVVGPAQSTASNYRCDVNK